jgi:hypothetical protein
MNVVMPVLAATVAAALHLRPAVEIALAALVVGPNGAVASGGLAAVSGCARITTIRRKLRSTT